MAAARPRQRRTWRIPPPPRRDTPEPEAFAVLAEGGELAGVLWESVRAVLLWASAADRDQLFSAGARALRDENLERVSDPALAEALAAATRVMIEPAAADGSSVAAACERVAAWAQANGRPAARCEFLTAACLAAPDDPRRAVELGKVLRDGGRLVTAEAWLQRAVALARAARDWDTYARAHIALGKLWLRRGRHPAARRSLERAIRASARHGAREAQAMAWHDLFTLEVMGHNYPRAVVCAARAARLYAPGSPGHKSLAFDVAYSWIEQGRAGAALPVLVAIAPHFEGRKHMVAHGALARAAGLLGDEARFAAAAAVVEDAADELPNKASILYELALGAEALGSHERVVRYLDAAEALASRFGETRIAVIADELRTRSAAAGTRGVPAAEPQLAEPDPELAELVELLEAAAAR
jgi:tetratricopeptide (TPR) repeat protein